MYITESLCCMAVIDATLWISCTSIKKTHRVKLKNKIKLNWNIKKIRLN